MYLNHSDPYRAGQVDGRLEEIERNGFEAIESEQFPGYVFRTRCKKCGHELKVNQVVWRLRHSIRCGA